ncbi:MAG: oligosaccharide flippase family protein, partial [Clostridia bacterium]
MIKRQSFLQSAIILTLSMAIVKLIGAFFKLPLAYIINENGMGYFNTAYNFYAVFFSLATAGFPVAISKLVSENYSLGRYSDVRKIKSLSLPIFFFSGFIGMCVMLVSAKVYTQFIGNSGAFLPIIVLSPSILFCSLNSIYRGYHEGLRDMYPTAISQVIEALTKLLLGIYLAFAVTEHLTAEYMQSSSVLGKVLSADNAQLTIFSCAAAAAILGVSCGTLLSFLFLLFYHKIKGDGIENISYQKPHSDKHIRKRLLKIALPIAIGSMTVSISALVDQTIVQKRLGDLMIENSAEILELYKNQIPEENLSDISTIPNFLFGCHAYAMTIFMLIPALTQAFGTSALPNLSMYWAKNNLKAV